MRDFTKEMISVKCSDCNTDFQVRYDTYHRRRNTDESKVWRCRKCLSAYANSFEKNITVTAKQRAQRSENNRKRWASYSADQKMIVRGNIKEGVNKYYQNLTDAEKENISKRNQELWDRLTPKEKRSRNEYAIQKYNEWLSSLGDLENELRILRLQQIGKDYYENLSSEEKENYAKKKKVQFDTMPQVQKFVQIGLDYIRSLPEDERNEVYLRRGKSYRKYLSELPEEEFAKMIDKLNLGFRSWYNSLTDNEKADVARSKIISGSGRNKFHKRFEEYFQASYISNDYYYKPEVVVMVDGQIKSWDYGIYDKATNTLQMVVDLDGAFYHADICDYDGLHSNEEYDERRYHLVPKGVKLAIINELRWKDSFERMIKDLMINYDEFVERQFRLCRSMPFPYPTYTKEALWKFWEHLTRMKTNLDDKYIQRGGGLSVNNRIGDRIIFHFHHSLYESSVGNSPSPFDAWHDDKLLRHVIKNRIIYVNTINPNKILQGFNISKTATRISIFSAGRARLIVDNLLPDFTEIFDPFSGLSGRMLGVAASGKKYIGQDISPIHVQESNEIIKFFGLENRASVTAANCLTSSGTYQCLFTCPPYGDKEKWVGVKPDKRSCDDWIDVCLKNFECQKYLFVVDNTARYKDYIVDEIRNKSHFSNNTEKVILIKK